MENEKKKVLLRWEDAERVQRSLLEWLNTCPVKPFQIGYENLPKDDAGICISTIQAPYKIRSYILGGYLAQYQFKIIYRTLPSDDEDQLDAVETLDKIGAWAEQQTKMPELPEPAHMRSVERDNNAAVFAAYDDGSRDYQILMSMTWEVLQDGF